MSVAWMIAGNNDTTVRKIDSSGNEVWSFTGHTDTIRAVVVDLLGNIYTGSEDGTVRKLDNNGNELWSFSGHSGSVYAVAVDSSGNVYSGGSDTTVRKIDSSGNELWSFTGHTADVQVIKYDSNLDVIYTASFDTTVCKIDSAGNEVWRYEGSSGWVWDLDFDSSGNVYSGSGDSYIRKINSSGNLDWEFLGSGFNAAYECVVYDPNQDAVYASTKENNDVYKIDGVTGNQTWSYSSGGGAAHIDFDASGNLYIADAYYAVVRKLDSTGTQVWEYTRPGDTEPFQVWSESDNGAVFVAFKDYNSSSDPAPIKKLDSSGNEVWSFNGFGGGTWTGAFVLQPDGMPQILQFDDINSASTISPFSFEGGAYPLNFSNVAVSASVGLETIDRTRGLGFQGVVSQTSVASLFIEDCVPLAFGRVASSVKLVSSSLLGKVLVGNIVSELPMFECDARCGSEISSELPMIEYVSVGEMEHTSNINGVLPSLSLHVYTGANCEIHLPVFSLGGEISTENIARIQAYLPSLSLFGQISAPSVCEITDSLPSLSLSMGVLTGNLVVCSASLPALSISMDYKSENLAEIVSALPMASINAVVVLTGSNQIEAALPSLDIKIASGSLPSEILRYVKGKVR